MDLFAATAAERRSTAGLLAGLTPQQQDTPSLCAGWTVRHVAAHLITPLEVGLPRFALQMARRRGDFDRAVDDFAHRLARRPWGEITAVLRAKADRRFTPPGKGPESPLTDVLVHTLDMTVPLGIEHHLDAEHVTVALDHLVSPASGGRRPDTGLDAVRLEASDLDWAHGEGPVVRGSAQDLLLALAGRDAGRERLTGPVPGRG